MSRRVVDASVALKWFFPEVHSDAAARLLDGPHDLVAPDLLGPEVGNVLWKRVRRGEITSAEAQQVWRAFAAIPIEIRPSRPLIDAAMEIGIREKRSVHDSLYLALALAETCRLVTADRKFYLAIAGGPLADSIVWVEDDT
ncbi:MAG: PIN domain-containing protein [Myxococcales bacterium]|nr:PIN domain-containing protein [Myxococcales bacterium]